VDRPAPDAAAGEDPGAARRVASGVGDRAGRGPVRRGSAASRIGRTAAAADRARTTVAGSARTTRVGREGATSVARVAGGAPGSGSGVARPRMGRPGTDDLTIAVAAPKAAHNAFSSGRASPTIARDDQTTDPASFDLGRPLIALGRTGRHALD
jgi:hypothetical protein